MLDVKKLRLVTQFFTGETRGRAQAGSLRQAATMWGLFWATVLTDLNYEGCGLEPQPCFSPFLRTSNIAFHSQSLGSGLLHSFLVVNSLTGSPLQRLRAGFAKPQPALERHLMFHCPVVHSGLLYAKHQLKVHLLHERPREKGPRSLYSKRTSGSNQPIWK